MKPRRMYMILILYFVIVGCYSESRVSKKSKNTQKGVLVYFMNEPYFFPTKATSLENISKSRTIGLKLDWIESNDILKGISHKNTIVVYANGENRKIDTIKSQLGILRVQIKTLKTKSKLSPDTAAFNFEYYPNKWALFKYEIRFDTEILLVRPIRSKDVKAFNNSVKIIQ